MTETIIKHGDWVVVCDGTKALVLENAGNAKSLELKTLEVYEQDDPKTSEQGTDAPGRALNTVGKVRSAVDQTDWHDQAEQRFLAQLAGRLDHAAKQGKLRRLIIVAPPRALGVLRHTYSHDTRGVLRAEIDKDLVKLPVQEIAKRLAA